MTGQRPVSRTLQELAMKCCQLSQIAQMVERWTVEQEVPGLNPTAGEYVHITVPTNINNWCVSVRILCPKQDWIHRLPERTLQLNARVAP